MTTGSRIQDNLANTSTDCGIVPIGLYSAKAWDGDNRLPLEPDNTFHRYVASGHSYSSPLIQWRGGGGPWKTGTYRSCFFGVAVTYQWSTNDTINLINRLAENVRRHKFDANVFVGEAHMSLRMIRDRSVSLYRALSLLRRGEVSAMARALNLQDRGSRKTRPTPQALSEIWLEYDFGWKPLVNDIYEASNAVFSLTNQPLCHTYTAGRKVNGVVNNVATGVLIPATAFEAHRLRVTLKEDYTPLESLNLLDPSTVMWELMPWSFVTDWIYPVGNYLQARSFLNSVNFDSSWHTTFRRMKVKTNTVSSYYEIKGEPYEESQFSVSRVAESFSLPYPSIRNFSEILSWKRAADSVALLTSKRNTWRYFY